MHLSFDLENPPPHPPTGCVDATLWYVAWALHRGHLPVPDGDGACTCGLRYPCWCGRLAVRGLIHACNPDPQRRWANLIQPRQV